MTDNIIIQWLNGHIFKTRSVSLYGTSLLRDQLLLYLSMVPNIKLRQEWMTANNILSWHTEFCDPVSSSLKLGACPYSLGCPLELAFSVAPNIRLERELAVLPWFLQLADVLFWTKRASCRLKSGDVSWRPSVKIIGGKVIKRFFSSSPTKGPNRLERLSHWSLSNPV